jgi:hypothetical protein
MRLNNRVPSGPSKFVLLPQQRLHPGQTYTVTFKGGPNAPHITDEAGTPLASDYTLSFTTAPAPQITTTTIFAPADMPDNPRANDQSSRARRNLTDKDKERRQKYTLFSGIGPNDLLQLHLSR